MSINWYSNDNPNPIMGVLEAFLDKHPGWECNVYQQYSTTSLEFIIPMGERRFRTSQQIARWGDLPIVLEQVEKAIASKLADVIVKDGFASLNANSYVDRKDADDYLNAVLRVPVVPTIPPTPVISTPIEASDRRRRLIRLRKKTTT